LVQDRKLLRVKSSSLITYQQAVASAELSYHAKPHRT